MTALDRDEVLGVLVARITAVMALDEASVPETAAFDQDLHADSLDLVEVIAGVERDLRARGHDLTVPDEDLPRLRTVGDAADRITTLLAAPAGATDAS